MPAVRFGDQLAFSSGCQKLPVHQGGIGTHDLIVPHKQKRRRHQAHIPKQRRHPGIRPVLRIAAGKIVQNLHRHGRIPLPVRFVGFSGCRQIRPGRNADDAAGLLHSQLPKLQAEGIAQAAAGTFAAESNMLRGISFVQQVPVGSQPILQGGRIGMLRCQPVGGAEHPDTAAHRQHGGKALGIFQIAAYIAAAMQVQHHTLPPFIPGHDPGSFKLIEGMVPAEDLPAVLCFHQFSHGILPFSHSLQRAASQHGKQKIHLCSDRFCR